MFESYEALGKCWSRVVFVIALAELMALASGCGGASQQRYVPAEQQARTAVETALNAWKAGQKEDESRTVDGAIQVKCLDQDWRAGKALSGFEVLEVRPSAADGPRQIRVRLTYGGEPQPVEAVYFVAGIDPLWVFREEDYLRTGGG